ncbi:right-handed parallel beta-helix repeat-containing protein [bacterium]|nr:right-handed parallel beta-helix repeat-containing protein [bacterium]
MTVLFLALLIAPPGVLARTFHLAPPPLGDDANPGSKALPWASFQKAASVLIAGDTVLVRGGVYAITSAIAARRFATSNAWITYEGWPGEQVIIDATNLYNSPAAFDIQNSAYTRLVNIGVGFSHDAAFRVYGANTHHIEIIDCSTYNTYGPGIRVQYANNVRLIGNEIVGANIMAMAPPGATASEPPHEAISVSSVDTFEIAFNRLHHNGKEAIDAKGTDRHGRIHHNAAWSNARQGLYVDAWHGLLEDVVFHHNVSWSNEWGFGISVEGADSAIRNLRFHHNLLYRNRASGVFFSIWGTNGPRNDLAIYNNTICKNGRSGHWAGPVGGIDMKSTNEVDVAIVNNLCAGNYAFELATFDDPSSNGLDRLAAQRISLDGNLSGWFRTNTYGSSPYGRVYALLGDNSVTGDPLVVNYSGDVYYLTSNSPAIDAGVNQPQYNDPDGSRSDIGALWYGAQDVPPDPLRITLPQPGVIRLEQHTVPGKTYQLMRSEDLQTWSPVGPAVQGDWAYIRTYATETNAARAFYRYEVRQ